MPDDVRLTQLSHGAGCGCKLRPADLARVLAGLGPVTDPRVLVGPGTRDDAAIYLLRDDLALVATTDFFTPVVDDEFLFGRIAAANALSDVYAMGGTPSFALSLVAWPMERLGPDRLGRVLAGARDACREAGIDIVGGHSIDDPEPKFGLAVTGTVHPAKVRSNAGARPGDVLVLTKPLGVGLATTALKKGAESLAIPAATTLMATLNRAAAEALADAPVHALTDVTGFGLLGHLWNVAEASGVIARIEHQRVPQLPGLEALVAGGFVPGGTRRNLADVASHVQFAPGVPEWERLVLADAQTNGGLLAAIDPSGLADLESRCAARGVPCHVFGRIEAGPAALVVE